jgi:hypothetical protein
MSRSQKISESRSALRKDIFPQVTEDQLWLRKQRKGFTTIPRALSLVMAIINRMSKGKPVSATYLELWGRVFDEGFILLKPREMTFHSGFRGERAEQTWSGRMRILEKLGLIRTAPGPEGDLSYAVMFNPYKVIKHHFDKRTPGLEARDYYGLLSRLSEIGATDLKKPEPNEQAAGPKIVELAKVRKSVPPSPTIRRRSAKRQA